MTLESIENASFWANVSVVALTLMAAAAGVVALYFQSRLDTTRDADLNQYKTEAAATIASADARAEEAKAKSEEARKETAKALVQAAAISERANALELEVANARLALAKLKTPRSLTTEQQKRLAVKLKEFEGTPFDFFVHTDPEAIDLMWQIADVLKVSGWIHHPVTSLAVVYRVHGKPEAGIVSFTGLEIQIDESRRADWERAVLALETGLKAEGIITKAIALTDKTESPNAIHIKVGKKP